MQIVPESLKPGTHIVFRCGVEAFPHASIPTGSTGVVTEVNNDGVWIKMDGVFPGLSCWDNELQVADHHNVMFWVEGLTERRPTITLRSLTDLDDMDVFKDTQWFSCGIFHGSDHRARLNIETNRWELWHKPVYQDGKTRDDDIWSAFDSGPGVDESFPDVYALMAYVLWAHNVSPINDRHMPSDFLKVLPKFVSAVRFMFRNLK